MKWSVKLAVFLLSLWLPLSAMSFLWFDKEIPLPTLKPVKPTLALRQLWQQHAVGRNGDKGSLLRFNPAVGERVVYVSGARGRVAAIDRFQGRTLWSTSLKVPLESGPTVGDGKVFVASSAAELIALNATNGKILWRVHLPNEVTASPAYGDGAVVVKNIDGNLYAFNAKTGKSLWKYEEGAPRLILRGGSSPVIFQGIVLAGFVDGKIAVIKLEDGRLLWQSVVVEATGISELTRMIDINATPVIDNGVVYVASYHGNISAISLQDAQLAWTHKLSSYTGAAVSPFYVFVTDTQGYVWAFNRDTGEVAWRQTALKRRKLTRAAVVGNHLVVADAQGMVHWLAADDGHFVARQRLSSSGFSADPVVSDDNTVYLQARDGSVFAEKVVS